jgi:hypothetical protein
MDTAAFLTTQAAKCRRLAAKADDKLATQVLLALALEFDGRAAEAAIQEALPKIQSISV